MSDPFDPSLPRAEQFGRLSIVRGLEPGWPCRHCGHPLAAVGDRTELVACGTCDRAAGSLPPFG